MKKIFLLLFIIASFSAAAQPRIEPIGKKTTRVQVQNELETLGDLYLSLKDTTGAAPSKLGAIRMRPGDNFPYVYLKTTGKKWYPIVPKSTFDTLLFANGVYYANGTIGVKIASTADTGVIRPTFYDSLLTALNKRVTNLTVTGDVTKTVTLTYADGTQTVQTFTDNATGGINAVSVDDIAGLFATTTDNTTSTAHTTFTPIQHDPYTVYSVGGATGAAGFNGLTADYIQSGIFSAARLPQASSTSTGTLSAADYNRLFIRQSFINPTGTITMNIAAGGQAGVSFATTGGRTLVFSNLRSGDRPKLSFNNTSGAAITLTLPSSSYIQGTGAATTVSIPTNRSVLQLEDFDGISFWFSLKTF